MGYISKQWLKGDVQRNRSHIPVPVIVTIRKSEYLDCKVTMTTTWLNGLGDEEHKSVDLTGDEVAQALPYFLREADLTHLSLDDPKRIAIVTSLSKISDAELTRLLSDIRAAQVEAAPLSPQNVGDFAAELGLPVDLLIEQLQAAGVGKLQESAPITEPDKVQLLAYLRKANNSDTIAKDERNIETKPAANTTDAQELQIMSVAVKEGKLARARMMLEAKQGKRKLDFVELRRLDMEIAQIEKELERSENKGA